MKCLLCSLHFIKEQVLKKHYVVYHFINDEDIYFKDLFLPDILDKTCRICNVIFKSPRSKKKHMFLFHYGKDKQIGGNRSQRTSTLPINVLNGGPITHYSINFSQHKNFYDFFSSGIVDAFLGSVYEIYRPLKENKIQGYAEIVNQQYSEIILEDKRVWLTNAFNSKHFNDFVRGEILDEITKRIIVNGQTGSSWHFKRFERLSVIVGPLTDSKKLFSS